MKMTLHKIMIVTTSILIAMIALHSPNQSGASAFCTTKIHRTTSTAKRNSNVSSTSRSQEGLDNGIKYLGSGPDATVRPGVVLVAPEHEYDHFLMKSAVFVYAIGLDDNQDMVIRGNMML
jgi:hypothetical protein